MASIMRDCQLSILDQTMLRMYVRHLVIFPFPNPEQSEEAVGALRKGLFATLGRYPFLAGTIEPADAQADRLTLLYPDSISEESIKQIFSVDFTILQDKNFDFHKLKCAGFPPSALPGDVFCPKLLQNHPGLDDAFAEGLISFKARHPVPVLAAQATFIPGGLVLSVYANHVAIDGHGIAQIYQQWSTAVRSQSQTEPARSSLVSPLAPASAESINLSLEPRQRLFDRLVESASSIECEEVRMPSITARAPALRSSPYSLAAKIFVFRSSTISKLTTNLSSTMNTQLSSFIVLAALLWTHVTMARSSGLVEKGIQQTKLCVAFDHRKNLGKDFVESYLGNCATGTLVSLPLSTMLASFSGSLNVEHLAHTAMGIKQTLACITLDWFQNRLSLFSRTPKPHQLKMDVDIPNGPDLFVTSWLHMGADCVWNIPGTDCQIPEAIRKPQSKAEGNIHILPRSKTGSEDKPFEVLLCLEEEEMERVVDAMEREQWVDNIVDA